MQGEHQTLRRAALAAGCATFAGAVIPVFRAIPQYPGLAQRWPNYAWAIWLALVLSVALILLLPLFFLALHRDRASLRILRKNRILVRVAMTVQVVLLCIGLVATARLLGPYFDPPWLIERKLGINLFDPVGFAQGLLSTLSRVSLLGVMLALVRHEADTGGAAVSGFLRITARAAATACGIVAAGNLVRVAALPYVYSTVSLQIARLPQVPTFWQLYGEPLILLADFATMFVPPYVVLKSLQAETSAPPT